MSENKEKISISIEADLLRRLDAVCEARGDSRSAVIERILRDEMPEEESFLQGMEDPMSRALIATLIRSPAVLKVIATVAGKAISDADLKRVQERAPEHFRRGKERERKKRGGDQPQILPGT